VRGQLRALLGPSGLREGDALAELNPGIDLRNLDAGIAALPANTAEVAAVVSLCHQHKIPIVPLGGRTGLAAAGVSHPGELVLLTHRMNRIAEIDPAAGTATVDAGVVLSALAAAVAPHGLYPAIDLGARDSCTIGGMIGTNAGGMEAHRHGTMRRRVLGLEVVMPNGLVLNDMKAVLKNNEGYDLKQLFIGAEGTLGVVTCAVLQLEQDPGERAAAYCHMTDAAAAVALLARLKRLPGGVILSRAEIMWREHVDLTAKANGLDNLAMPKGACVTVIFEAASLEPGLAASALEGALGAAMEEAGGAGLVDVLMPKNTKETRDVWHIREDWAVTRAYPHGLHFDISVPLARIEGYMRALQAAVREMGLGFNLFVLGHLADGNLHVTVNAQGRPIPEMGPPVADAVYAGLHAMGGSISAEHGIGLNKRAGLEKFGDPVKLAMMLVVKRAVDPVGLMNPGKVLGNP
jgi:FAD/FMN-containing dehydrogenase